MEMTECRKIGLRKNLKIQIAIKTILKEIGEDPLREGLMRTPFRVAKAYEEWYGGYGINPKDVLDREFSERTDMVIEGPISFYSHCEHHMAPFYGDVWVGYIPKKFVTGLDKLVKIVEVYSRRLQVQERMTEQIADAIYNTLKCNGVMVVIKAQHLCINSRETKNFTTKTVTSAVRGYFKKDFKVKQEFLELIR